MFGNPRAWFRLRRVRVRAAGPPSAPIPCRQCVHEPTRLSPPLPLSLATQRAFVFRRRRGHESAPCRPCRPSHAAGRRECGRCGARLRRRAHGGRAGVERDRQRRLRPGVGRGESARPERLGPRRRRPRRGGPAGLARDFSGVGMAGSHRAGRAGYLAGVARALREARPREDHGPGHRVRGERISRLSGGLAGLVGGGPAVSGDPASRALELGEGVRAPGERAGRRRALVQPRPRGGLAPARRPGPSRLLRGRDREPDSRVQRRDRGTLLGAGPRFPPQRVGGADHGLVPRSRGMGDPPERTGQSPPFRRSGFSTACPRPTPGKSAGTCRWRR